jgi:hypothetical protein
MGMARLETPLLDLISLLKKPIQGRTTGQFLQLLHKSRQLTFRIATLPIWLKTIFNMWIKLLILH